MSSTIQKKHLMHKIKKLPLIHQIVNCQKSTNWDLGNSVLYNLCENNFDHSSDEKIIAKVWLIGRVYAAAIERRRINDYQINEMAEFGLWKSNIVINE